MGAFTENKLPGILRSDSRRPKRKASAAGHTSFDGGAFLIIVPRNDEQEGQRVLVVIIAPEKAQRIFERTPATRIHVTVARPGGMPVVESRPGSPDRQLVRILRRHLGIKIVQILAAPVAAI